VCTTRLRGAGLGLLTAALACATPLRQQRLREAVDVPPAWSAALAPDPGAGPPAAAERMGFDDPLLDRLVAQAMRTSTSVEAARAALGGARAARDVTGAAAWPSLDASASARQGKTRGTPWAAQFTAGLSAAWELDVFGVQRNARAAGGAAAEASAASLGDVRVSITAEVGLAYLALRSAQAQFAVAGVNLASQRETLQIVEWRQQAGLVTSLEVEQARAAAAQTGALVPALQTRIDQTSHALAVLTGQPPASLSAVLAAPGAIPEAAGELALAIPAETLRRRADVRAAELRVVAAGSRVASASAARAPRFDLGGTLGVSAVTLGALTSGASLAGALVAAVAMPLLDGGAGGARVRVQEAALDQAVAEYRAAVLSALAEVEDALGALRDDRLRVASLTTASESAGLAATLARQRFESGLVDFQTVLETQRTQLSTQSAVAVATADLGADHVRLFAALGGGWRPEVVDPAPAPTAAAPPRPTP